jgi:peptide deformylase
MAIREILKMGDPRLLQPAQPVQAFDTAQLHQLLQDMRETMKAANGAGLAAPQIGVSAQVVIFGSGEINPRYPHAPVIPYTEAINPVIHPLGDEMEEGWEGCLSVPGLRAVVPRYAHIRFEAFDVHGKRFEAEMSGFHARVVQHECDHLLGKLYPMRIKDFSRFGFVDVLFPEMSAL